MPCIPYFICLFNVYPFQCQPSPPPSGAIKFGDTAEECTPSIAGTVRYSTSENALELCDGSSWSPLVTAGLGQTPDQPGRSCLHILNAGEFYVLLITPMYTMFSRDVIKL